jgi:hypothetical protein
MSSNFLRDLLASRGIRNGRQLAEHTGAKATLFFLVHSDGRSDPRAELRYQDEGQEQVKTFRPTSARMTMTAMRRSCVQEAQEFAEQRLGIAEWRRAPFSNCWLPAEAIERMREETRDEQRA